MTCGEAKTQHAAATIPPKDRRIVACRFCGQDIIWGLTLNGRRAPFDPDTLRNHWITCPRQGEARKAFPRKRLTPGEEARIS